MCKFKPLNAAACWSDISKSSGQCFGSGSGSMWIRIEMALLDPDPDPYWEYGSGSRTVKMVSKKGKKSETSSLKEHSPFS